MAPNPPGFNPTASMKVCSFTHQMTDEQPERQGIPAFYTPVQNPDGTTGLMMVPAQTAFFSPEVNAYLFYCTIE